MIEIPKSFASRVLYYLNKCEELKLDDDEKDELLDIICNLTFDVEIKLNDIEENKLNEESKE